MVQNPAVPMVLEAMDRLGWSPAQLHTATVAYGSIGTIEELRHHLATGEELRPGAAAVLVTTLHEGLLDQDQPSPFYLDPAAGRQP